MAFYRLSHHSQEIKLWAPNNSTSDSTILKHHQTIFLNWFFFFKSIIWTLTVWIVCSRITTSQVTLKLLCISLFGSRVEERQEWTQTSCTGFCLNPATSAGALGSCHSQSKVHLTQLTCGGKKIFNGQLAVMVSSLIKLKRNFQQSLILNKFLHLGRCRY